MAARARVVQYNPTSSGTIGDGRGAGCKGTMGYSIGTSSIGDQFTIGQTTNKLYLSIDGDSSTITLYSGALLDPRYVARDITEKLRNLGKSDARYDQAYCEFSNQYDRVSGNTYNNCFKIYSGSMGSSSSVVVSSGTDSAHSVLGFDAKVETGGAVYIPHLASSPYTFNGTVSTSGTYYGLFDETYSIVVSNDNHASRGIGTATKGGANTYDGTITTGGIFNNTVDITYTIIISTSNGSTMGAGTGNVPTMTWTSSTATDNSSGGVYVELLYPDHWYKVGTKGLMVKFSDAVFNTANPAWTIACYKPDYATGTNASAVVGSASYVYSSNRGDMSSVPLTTVSGGYSRVGTKGLYVMFNPTGGSSLSAGEEFTVRCTGPKPLNYNITSLNYGNVTVSTESAVKCILFEVEAGAVEVSSVKFGQQSHGSFNHHDEGNSDTKFRFGTVGQKNKAGSGEITGIEWYPGIVAGDIDNDTPPAYLYSTKENLHIVDNADDSESIGSYGLTSDVIYVNIRLGTAETGANSSLNSRFYYDYS
jgi:hypothetical protein